MHYALKYSHYFKNLHSFHLYRGALVAVQDKKGSKAKKKSFGGGRTAVHYAAYRGHAACLKLLLENTEDASVADSKDAAGQTPLMLAAEKGHLK